MNPIRREGSFQSLNQGHDKQRKLWLETVLKEITINSPDSITISRSLLAKREIYIKELDELHSLQQNTISSKRDEIFSKKSKELQQKIIHKLKEIE